MSLQKQKNLLKKARIRFRMKPIPPRVLRMAEPVAFVAGIFVVVLCLQFAGKPTPVHPAPTAHKKKTHHAVVSHKATKQVAAAPAATPPPPAASPPAPPVRAPAPTAGSSKVEPVVTPSPASSVSGLAPTSQSSPGSSGSSGGQVTTGYTSTNWSGYMATNGTFTSVSGSWRATQATGNGTTTSADSTWIGIGGVTSSDLIQVGTQNIISATGQVSTSAFYEMLPDVSQPVPGITVTPGDSMSASVREVGTSLWMISITDNTNGQSYTTTVSYASSLSSAEWIEEDPSYSFRRQIPFDNFNAAYFSGGFTTFNGAVVSIAASTAQPVIMVNNAGQYIAVPSVIGGDGASFSVTP